MTEITIVSWRDIPAQIIAGRGRKAIKVQLSDKFEKAIDRCAMKTNMKDSEAYLSEWNKSTFKRDSNSDLEAVEQECKMLEQKFDTPTLTAYIENGGWTPE